MPMLVLRPYRDAHACVARFPVVALRYTTG
jgi:hypothetical protein